MIITMARYTVRKTFDGQVLEEKIEQLPELDTQSELIFLGQLYANKLNKDKDFYQYCQEYQRQLKECAG